MKEFIKDLSNRFQNTNKIFDGDLNKFCQMSRKGVYAYKRMDNWQSSIKCYYNLTAV